MKKFRYISHFKSARFGLKKFITNDRNRVLLACLAIPFFSFASAERVDADNSLENYISVPAPQIFPSMSEELEINSFVQQEIDEVDDFENNQSDELAKQIIEYAATHVGRPYRYGSGGPKTFDCSGFTSYIFKNFGVGLTRSSRSQYAEGEKVNREDIKPGDLLFFKGRRSNSVGHVGIAVDVDDNGKIKFIHAATSKGVSYSTLDESYYAKRYIGARRVLNN